MDGGRLSDRGCRGCNVVELRSGVRSSEAALIPPPPTTRPPVRGSGRCKCKGGTGALLVGETEAACAADGAGGADGTSLRYHAGRLRSIPVIPLAWAFVSCVA